MNWIEKEKSGQMKRRQMTVQQRREAGHGIQTNKKIFLCENREWNEDKGGGGEI